jgi:tetratricopeptide (TPR) repeat protein
MRTPAQRRRDFVLAQRAAPHQPAANPNANAYELMLAKLHSDQRRLRQLQSIERRNDIKRQLLPEYDAWVDGALAADNGGQDDVVTTIMIWRIDTGDYDGALKIAAHVLRHGLTLPENYKRTPATLIAEEIAMAALSPGGAVPLATLSAVFDLTETADMPDEVRAKLLKAIGLAQEADGLLPEALASLTRAITLHDKVGVKRDMERIQRALKSAGSALGEQNDGGEA